MGSEMCIRDRASLVRSSRTGAGWFDCVGCRFALPFVHFPIQEAGPICHPIHPSIPILISTPSPCLAPVTQTNCFGSPRLVMNLVAVRFVGFDCPVIQNFDCFVNPAESLPDFGPIRFALTRFVQTRFVQTRCPDPAIVAVVPVWNPLALFGPEFV